MAPHCPTQAVATARRFSAATTARARSLPPAHPPSACGRSANARMAPPTHAAYSTRGDRLPRSCIRFNAQRRRVTKACSAQAYL
eukprot:959037-Pleurochrysis_carterae.AAC.2